MKVNVLYVILAFLMISCSYNQDKILQQAESLMEAYPDSTLTLLKSIDNPSKLALDDYNKYILLRAKAEYKQGIDIQEDTLLFHAKHFFISTNDMKNAAWASLYCGHTYYKQNEYDKALFEYLESEKYANHLSENHLKGIVQYAIGNVYTRQALGKREALDRFLLANKYFQKTGDIEDELRATQAIGDCYLHMHNDSAFIYYEKAIEISNKISGS